MSFVHLHRHSEFSRLDGIGTAKQYADRAAELGQFALALTDHGTLSGALHHIVACQNAGIIPISGVEAYFRPNRILAKKFKQQATYHLCLFAKNLTGWHNLLRIVSVAYDEPENGGGFYGKPCVDFELLGRYREGIVATSACVSSWLSHLIEGGDHVSVEDYLNQMLNLYGDDFWIEIQPHDFDEQRDLNQVLVDLAKDFSIPLLATNDAHFPYAEWAETQRIAKLMGSGGSMKKIERMKPSELDGSKEYLTTASPTLYLASEREMMRWFWEHHFDLDKHAVREAIENTALFAQRLEPYVLGRSFKLPRVTEAPGEAEEKIREWMEEGLGRVAARGVIDFEAYEERAEEEFAILKSKGVLDYFVMVGEIVRWCKEQGIRVGLGRGSAAGCLVSYLIGITQIDPIAYGLLFERFLNPDRKGLPDIDLDFQSDRRAEVKQFIADRYGHDHVADIITHTTFQPKKVIQDLCRVFDDRISYTEAMAITNTIEIRQDDEETTLEELVPLNEVLRRFSEEHREIWTHALRLEGQVANAGKHAAGVIITPKPISEYMALERGKSGDLVTSWSDAADFPVVSDYGFVKLDALSITGLEKHEYACRLIEQRFGEAPDLYDLSALYNPGAVDPEVMEGFRQGWTIGVFQFGGRGITTLLRAIQPDYINDLAAANALYRPGPMKGNVHHDYARRKQDPERRTYWHPLVQPVLEETYGLVAYQEQVMEITRQLGGFSAAQADDMRKAMGKLYRIKGGKAAKDYMRRFEEQWFEGCEERGIDRAAADEIWHKILEFGHYGFNKSHSASYALQAYQDMWLKMKYPAEFYAAFLTYEDDEEKRKQAIREAKSRGIEFVLPDVNKSALGYTVDDEGRLVLGLISIKGVGERAAEQIISKRPFGTLLDFLARAGRDANTQALIESGALDSIADRAWLLSIVPKIGSKEEAEWAVWEHLKHNTKLKNPREVPEQRREPSADTLLRLQAAALNMSATSIRMDPRHRSLLERNCHSPEELLELPRRARSIVGGEIAKVIHRKTKNLRDFANVVIVFDTYEWTVKFWDREYHRYRSLLSEGRIIMVEGKKDEWNGNITVIADNVAPIEVVLGMEEAA